MRCPSCGTKDLPVTRGAYRCCGIVTRLSDNGYIPAPGYTPSPLRVPAPSPFKELPAEPIEEKGWSQAEADELSASVPKRPHPNRLPETDPRNVAWREKLSHAIYASTLDPDVKLARRAGQERRRRREGRRVA